jgi:PAS domain S-box-containing protein
MVLPDGVVKHILDIGRPVFNGAGDVGEFVGTTVDVTERRRAEETLRRSEAYLAEAQRLTHTGSWAYVPATEKAIYWSKEMFRIFDLDPQQGPPAAETVLQRIHPEDRDSTLGIFRKAALEKTELEHHHRLVLPDGTVKYIHVIGHPVFDLSGQVIEFVGTNVDETERKRAEEEVRTAETRFRASVDHLTDALFIHDDQDDQGRVMDVNQQACDSLGYSREELIGMTAFDYDALVDATFMRSIKEQVARGEIFSFESVHRRKDGTTFPVEVRARPFWHGDHRFGLALVRDITDRKRAQAERERLRQLEAELAHMNRVSMMGELAASIAHELNQPLSGVVVNGNACLRWLAGESPNLEEARENARRIVRDGKRAGDIIGRIRALATKTATAMARLDMNETVQEVIALAQTEVRRNGVTLRTELADDLSPVLGDRVQLQQVVLNLVMNAVEAMSTVGERPRELAIRTQNDDGDLVRITVQDSGIGLDPQSMERIFDAFYTTKSGGMGMGLSISRSIVQNHGGRLSAVANDGPGTTLQFTLQKYDSAARNSVVGA